MNSGPGKLIRELAILTALILGGSAAYSADQPSVNIQPTAAGGSCQIAQSTQTAVIRNYLQAWRNMATAFGQNTPGSLDSDFVGVAKEKLSAAVRQQQQLGLTTHYQDQKHDLTLFFCSPEGMSVELVDAVEYEVSIEDHDQTHAPEHVRTRYVAVLTPTETRWKVRIFQAEPKTN